MKSTFIKYLVLCFALLSVTEITKIALNYDQLLYNSLAEKLTSNQINNFLNLQQKWQWVSYAFVPVFLLIKTSLIASVLYIGVFFSNNDVSFKSIWDKVLKAEFILLLVPVFKIGWFYFIQNQYTLEDFQYFFPLSALNIVGYKGLEKWFVYPFQLLNLFEVAYIIFLGFQIGAVTKTNADNGLRIVAASYVPALLLWASVIMFFTLNYS